MALTMFVQVLAEFFSRRIGDTPEHSIQGKLCNTNGTHAMMNSPRAIFESESDRFE